MHTVTRNCSLGHYENCHCDNSKKGTIGASGWTWGGCSDNVRFGEQVSIGFLDTRERGHDVKALVNLHNNDIGRKVVRNTMKRICKCHGVSGSCATQTCWMRLAEFSVIGDRLKQVYNKAKQIDYEYNRLNFGKERRNTDAGPLNFPKKHLVYIESSPEYCYANETAGSHGTEGRECSRSKGKHVPREERKSCKNLCRQCGLRVRKKVLHVESSCNCKFHWCCEVKCEVCRKKVTQFVCHR
ncbi:protein Wnt-8c-like [Tachypleus tridentatus]|uniref:protein Wnt-8c-like n=1 Tax=Tachypleus tridentatus TaxID=6853 RepID=UPI003FD52A05